ncbi:MAG: FAD-binding oxidoreductase [Ignavibacteria bacterium]|nr:FAD-binding oxidoreductase [Ignavibacteria bacterium]
MVNFFKAEISGFGKYPKALCKITRPSNPDEIKSSLSNGTSVIPRGLGRSYGDASLNSKGYVVESLLLNKFISFDDRSGVLKCESGVTYNDILKTFVKRGWFPGVTPGTKYVTIGGAIASDVHGKNHHKEGSFSNFLISFKILTADSELLECSREKNSDLFWATVGGMGMTGFITEAEIKLKKITSVFIKNKTLKLKTLEELFEKFEENDDSYIYSVAWIDTIASGADYGRSILYLGNHADKDELPYKTKKSEEIKVNYGRTISIPFEFGFTPLNRLSLKLFNASIYNREKENEDYIHFNRYFYPLDSVLNWNNIYGKNGFVQYQLIVPEENGRTAIDKILHKVVSSGGGSFLAVLKKMGDQEGLLSFPFKGYTLAMDFPVKPGLTDLCRELDKILLDYGGRTYLTKDSILDENTFKKMYDGKWQKWLSVKQKYDPACRFRSELGERIGLCQVF